MVLRTAVPSSSKDMEPHIQLSGASCIICRRSVEWFNGDDDQIAAVLAEAACENLKVTSPFPLPAHSHRIQYTQCHDHGEPGRWRLCRVPRCANCMASPETVTFHTDCFNTVMETVRRKTSDRNGLVNKTLRHIWLAGYWSRPWTKASYDCPLPRHCAVVPPELLHSATELSLLMQRVGSLPPELRDTIVGYSCYSLVWRLVAASTWHLSIFGRLRDTIPRTIPLKDLGSLWIRGSPAQGSLTESQGNRVRITLDCDGIKAVEVLAHRDPLAEKRACGSWYILEDVSQIGNLCLSSEGLLRLQANECILWDIPTPPVWDSCYFFGGDARRPLRIRSISLGQSVSGLTAFCAKGSIYGLYAHHGNSSAAESFSKLSLQLRLQLQQQVLWLYFPFCPGEYIQNIWVRYREGPIRTRLDVTLMIHTSNGRVCVFGEYIPWSAKEYKHHLICTRRPNQLLYYDPDPGQPIKCFGTGHPPLNTSATTLSRALQIDLSCPYERSLYYSRASLEHVQWVQCFYNGPFCIGILFDYADQRRAALGQCRISDSPSTRIFRPTAMYVKKERLLNKSGSGGVLVYFTDKSEQGQEADWEWKPMKGNITWWFNSDVVEIVYS